PLARGLAQPKALLQPLTRAAISMLNHYRVTLALLFLVLFQGCTHPGLHQALRQGVPATDAAPQLLAVYEPWFGHPNHISVGYSSHDPVVIRKQIDQAKALGISGF